ncbi:MAG: hypothetical protein H6682_12360 [Candidatus Eisenbacteria bacterium]|nr:hypothetical protein [Candidatus Eisenbacteria bacterium]
MPNAKTCLIRGTAALASALIALGATASAHAETFLPRDLLIYYSWPSLINGSGGDVALAAAEFGAYDDVVFGDLIETPEHPDHANTVAILAHPSMDDTRTFGYIDLGVAPGQNLTLAEIETRMQQWQATGVDGIFLDDFGYDYSVTRERQNAAIALAHGLSMPVVANAWVPAQALGSDVDPIANPDGLPTLLGTGDFYLFESFQIQEGAYVPEAQWQAKAESLEGYRQSTGIGVFTVTTMLPEDVYDEAKFHYAWFSGFLYGYESVGWGEYLFSALDALAPFHARPSVSPGTAFVGGVVHASPLHWRDTDAGRIRVNTSTHEYAFLDGTSGVGEDAQGTGLADLQTLDLQIAPNPTMGTVRIQLRPADESSTDELVVWPGGSAEFSATENPRLWLVDASGRVRATEELPAGHAWDWSTPPGLSNGVYSIVLRQHGQTIARGTVHYLGGR